MSSRPLLMIAVFFAAALLFLPHQSGAQETSGWTSLVWRVAQNPEVPVESTILFTSDAGVTSELRISEQALRSVGGALAIDRKHVVLGGVALSSVSGNSGSGPRVIQAASIQVVGAPLSTVSTTAGAPAQSGSKSYVTVLCRFADSLDVAPKSELYYKNLMTGAERPGLNHYWKEVSDNRIDLAGTVVAGWYNLPGKKADYFPSGKPDTPDWQKMLNECTGVADADVDFSKFFGVNLQFDLRMNYSWGGAAFLSRDGISRIIPTTWMASWATQHTYAHEMGHSLGLPHSSGPYQATYDSRWDPMSGGAAREGSENVAVHTIGFHKDVLGWIPLSQKYTAPAGVRQTITLQRLAVPGASTDYLMAQVPIGTTGTFYTVEARNQNGYDSGIPGEAVIIHKVDPRLPDRAAQVVDSDGNGNPNDAGAMWSPGETFTDLVADLSVTVVSVAATTFRVTIQRGSEPVAIASSSVRTGIVGAEYADTVKATGGLGTFSFTVGGGALPPGVLLGNSTGALSGVPTKAGNYTFAIVVSSGSKSDVREFGITVGKPSLQAQQVLDQLLGIGGMTTDQVRFLDLIGNNNGRVDVGDVRAWLIDGNQISADMQKQFEQIVGPLKPQVKEKK